VALLRPYDVSGYFDWQLIEEDAWRVLAVHRTARRVRDHWEPNELRYVMVHSPAWALREELFAATFGSTHNCFEPRSDVSVKGSRRAWTRSPVGNLRARA